MFMLLYLKPILSPLCSCLFLRITQRSCALDQAYTPVILRQLPFRTTADGQRQYLLKTDAIWVRQAAQDGTADDQQVLLDIWVDEADMATYASHFRSIFCRHGLFSYASAT